MNIVLLQGVLSSQPRERVLPSGDLLVNWELTTTSDGIKQSVPVSWFDPPKSIRLIASGAEVTVLGSIARRFFKAQGRTVSRTEVVGEQGVRSSRVKQVERICGRALDRLDPAA